MGIDIKKLKDSAQGNWHTVFSHFLGNYDARLYDNPSRHGSCPICGGTDRFRFFPDTHATGGAICNQCGPSPDGISLLKKATGEHMPRLLEQIEALLGSEPAPTSAPSPAQKNKRGNGNPAKPITFVWNSLSVSAYDPAAAPIWRYLANRGINIRRIELSNSIRYCNQLHYYDESGKQTEHPGMVANVIDGDGQQVTLHRTFLTPNGQKAPVSAPKKLMPVIQGRSLNRSGIHVGGRGPVLHISEGIETALAVMQMTGCTGTYVAALDANRLEQMRLAKQRRVIVWGDHDRSRDGDHAAEILTYRLNEAGYVASYMIPDSPMLQAGEKSRDWLDVLAQGHQDMIELAANQAGLSASDVKAGCERNEDTE